MANGNLTFKREWDSIQSWGKLFGISKVDIIRNPKAEGSVFWSALTASGEQLSGPIFGEYQNVKRVVECVTPEGEQFFALSSKDKPSDNVLTTISL